MSDEPKRKVHEGQVLPPEGDRTPVASELPPGTPFGIAMLARAKYQAQARAMRAFNDFTAEQITSVKNNTSLLGSMKENLSAREQLAFAGRRHGHLARMLDVEEAKFLAELDDDLTDLANSRRDKEYGREKTEVERRIEMAALQARAAAAEAQLKATENAANSHSQPGEKKSRAQRIAEEIAAVWKDYGEIRKMLIDKAGGEENLTDDIRRQLDSLALKANNAIQEIMENL